MKGAFTTETTNSAPQPSSEPAASARLSPSTSDVGYLTRAGAAAYLSDKLGRTVSVEALHRHASDLTGPQYVIILGRASYRPAWLDGWVDGLVEPPASRRGRGRNARKSQQGVRRAESQLEAPSRSEAAATQSMPCFGPGD